MAKITLTHALDSDNCYKAQITKMNRIFLLLTRGNMNFLTLIILENNYKLLTLIRLNSTHGV
jgi:hypothetical protein